MEQPTKKWLIELGANVRRIRIDKMGERSQTALAREAGTSRQNIWNIENGETNPTITLLETLASTLDCDVQDFLP